MCTSDETFIVRYRVGYTGNTTKSCFFVLVTKCVASEYVIHRSCRGSVCLKLKRLGPEVYAGSGFQVCFNRTKTGEAVPICRSEVWIANRGKRGVKI